VLQVSLADIVLLALLVCFFGVQQRSRPQLFFRFWFVGWVFVSLSVAVLGLEHFAPALKPVFGVVRVDLLLLGAVSFAVSFVAHQGRVRRTTRLALVLCAPAWVAIALLRFTVLPYWMVVVLVLLGQALVSRVTLALVPAHWVRQRRILVSASMLAAVVMIAVSRADHGYSLPDWMLAQIFLYAAFLYAGTAAPRSIVGLVGTFGFSLWGAGYIAVNTLASGSPLLGLVHTCWEVPKYCVAFGMILFIFEDSRRESEELADSFRILYDDFRLLYEDHPHPMWIYDAESLKFLSVNRAATQRYGYTEEDFLGMTVQDICGPEPAIEPGSEGDGVEDGATGVPALYLDQSHEFSTRHRDKDGKILAVETTDHEILFHGKGARFVLAVDTTERERLNQELVYLAHHDTLTGLQNRSTLEDHIQRCLTRSIREQTKAVLFTIDVDRFKLINDTYGHLAGDACLKAISARLQTRIRQVDTLARTGGEEFTAVIGSLKRLADAERVANSLLRLFDEPLDIPGHDIKVSISIGGAIYPDDGVDSETLRRRSDQALYHAKRSGRNRAVFASAEVCAEFDQATEVERALEEALEHEGFELQYQPIFDREGEANIFKAELRMIPSATTLFAPAVFLPVAEESGLIVPIGAWVIQAACRQIARWRENGADDRAIALHVSCLQLLHRDFCEIVLEALRENEVPPQSLYLELTEATLMTDHQRVIDSMTELAQAGLKFSIAGFGMGYTSLARLAGLPIDTIKIDPTFVAQLGKAETANGVVSAIIQIARTMHVVVVAEGIERADQLALLQELGCDLFQFSGATMGRGLPRVHGDQGASLGRG
jgi:diguanylate cyclase (GGDEF)-like protein/PAS domain S-box-containing protein